MNTQDTLPLPLDGITVIDWTIHVAAPSAGRILAQLGAKVIKMEPPAGDPYRHVGADYGLTIGDEHNPFFAAQNMGKQFIGLDLKQPAASEVLHRLLEKADVLLTNIRGKALDKLGFGYDALKEKYPRLIYAHLTGYGDVGPDKDLPGYDYGVFWAQSGNMADWVAPGEAPHFPALGFGDIATGTSMYAAIATALYAREKTGKGTRVTTSLLSNGIYTGGNNIFLAQKGSDFPFPIDQDKTLNPFARGYRCKDGNWVFVVIVPLTPQNWVKGCNAFGMQQYIDDPRFGSTETIVANGTEGELVQLVAEAFLQRTAAEWVEHLKGHDVVACRLLHASEVSEYTQALENGFLQSGTSPNGESLLYPDIPMRFSQYGTAAPQVDVGYGNSTTQLLLDAGYTSQQIEELRQNGAVL